MATINWDQKTDDALGWKEGVYLAEIAGAEEKASRSKGDPMFIVRFDAVDFGSSHLADDVVMLGGKGWSIGRAKLEALGFDESAAEIAAGELIGRRVYLRLAYKDEEYDGKTFRNLRVETRFRPEFSSGYWPDGDDPPDVRVMRPGGGGDDDPGLLDVSDAPF